MSKAATPTVMKMHRINFADNAGNMIPHKWYKSILFNGKADAIGIMVLAEIVYWYRPVIILHPRNGTVARIERRFSGDKLQKNPRQLSEKLGFSQKQIRDALDRLQESGLIDIEVRKIRTEKAVIPRVMFIEVNADRISQITELTENDVIEDDDLSDEYTEEACDPQDITNVPQDITNVPQDILHRLHTKNSTENTKEIDPDRPQQSVQAKAVEDSAKIKAYRDAQHRSLFPVNENRSAIDSANAPLKVSAGGPDKDGQWLRVQIQDAGFTTYGVGFMKEAAEMEETFKVEQLIRALQNVKEVHAKKIASGEKGIWNVLSYMRSILLNPESDKKGATNANSNRKQLSIKPTGPIFTEESRLQQLTEPF